MAQKRDVQKRNDCAGAIPRIVIFDGEEEIAKWIEDVFPPEVATVKSFTQASIGNKQILAVVKPPPKFILVDFIDGNNINRTRQVISLLQKQTKLKNIPIIVCSKFIDDTPQGKRIGKTCLGIGADRVFRKVPLPRLDEIESSLQCEQIQAKHPNPVIGWLGLHWQVLIFILCALLSLALAVASICVVAKESSSQSCMWVLCITSVSLGLLSIGGILTRIVKIAWWEIPMPKKADAMLDELLSTKDTLRDRVYAVVSDIKESGKPISDAKNQRWIRDVSLDVLSHAGSFSFDKTRDFFLVHVFLGSLSVIAVFAAFYLVDYSFERPPRERPIGDTTASHGQLGSGFVGSAIPFGNAGTWVIESVYYSTTTFATVASGSIYPTSWLARFITTCETLIVVAMFSLCLNLATRVIQARSSFSDSQIVDALKSHVKNCT